MNKSTHVIFLGAFTLAFGFIACSAAEDIESSATAGHTSTAGSVGVAGSPHTGSGGTGSAGRTSTGGAPATNTAGAPPTSGAGAPATSSGGSSSPTIDPNVPSSGSTSNGCSLGLAAVSNGAFGGLAIALALAFAARRRVRKPSDPD